MDNIIIRILIGICGITLGIFLSRKMGDSKNSNILKILIIILIILFALWNEGVFG